MTRLMEYRKVRAHGGAVCRSCNNKIPKGDWMLKTLYVGSYCRTCGSMMMNQWFKELIEIAGIMDHEGHAKLSLSALYNLDGKLLE